MCIKSVFLNHQPLLSYDEVWDSESLITMTSIATSWLSSSIFRVIVLLNFGVSIEWIEVLPAYLGFL